MLPNLKKFPIIKILDELPKINSLFETIVVTVNDNLVQQFLNEKIKFTDISKNLLKIISYKEFEKYKGITPKNINDILELSKYVSLKMNTLSI